MTSLRLRFSLWLSVSLTLFVILAWIGGVLAARTLTENYIHTRLEHDAENLLLAVSFDVHGALELDMTHIPPIYSRVFSGHYFVVSTPNDVEYSRSLWDENLAAPRDVGVDEPFHLAGPRGAPMLALKMAYEKDGRSVDILIAEDVSEFRALAAQFLLIFGLTGGGFLLLLLAGLQGLIRISLRPVDETVTQLREMHGGERDAIETRVPSEIAPLTREINNLTALFARRLERSRTALGNLAHAIKTPLALARQSAQRLPEREARDLNDAIERINDSVERELKRARLAGASIARQRVATRELVDDLLGVLGKIYAERGLVFDIHIPDDHLLVGDQADLSELFGNALENACKWARGKVRIGIRDTDRARCVTIEDDGPGLEAGEVRQLIGRGARLDEAVPGHGLGLAIMQDIVTEYGGTLDFGRGELGGLRVTVCLPRPEA
jgi:signal transduction histidine kinase